MEKSRTFGKFLDHCSKDGMIYYPGAGNDFGTLLELYESNSDIWSNGDIWSYLPKFKCKSKNGKNYPVFVMLDRETDFLDYIDNKLLVDGKYYNGLTSAEERTGLFTKEKQTVKLTNLPTGLTDGRYFEIEVHYDGYHSDTIPCYYLFREDKEFMPRIGSQIRTEGIIYLKQGGFSGRSRDVFGEEFYREFIIHLDGPSWVIGDQNLNWPNFKKFLETPYISYDNKICAFDKNNR